MRTSRYTLLPLLISIIFFIIPFFWLGPGQMDLGGDSSRLYFYDPLSYFKNYSFFGVSPSGFGAENIGYFTIPFVLLLFVLKFVLQSPTILISAFHGMSLSIGFLASYFIVKELIGNKAAALLAGLFYVLSLSPIQGWDKVLIIHNQFFLNPLIFFLLLRYFKTTNTVYLTSILLVGFIFSPNFSFAAAPPIFAFYPLAIIFLLFYTITVFKKPIIWKHLIISFVAFLFLQAFHLIPQVVSTFSPDSVLYKTVFSDEGKFDRGLSYFVSIASSIKVSINFMSLPQMTKLGVESLVYIIFPAIILFGYLRNKSRTVQLSGIFFLIALFFSSANITNVGFNFYKMLFYIPGFSMFRNFYGQWGYVLLFFYTILLGQSLAIVLSKLKRKYSYFLAVFIALLLVITAWPFINGTLVNKVLWQSKDVKIAMRMDPKYEEMLSFVRNLPDGKILTLPLSDPGYQILRGVDGGAYQGPSTIAYLAGKQDFAGFDELGKFNGLILDLVREKQFDRLKKVLEFLNIRYIFYNADPNIYDTIFPAFPYGHVRQFLPEDQKSYQKFIKQLSLKQLKTIDNKYFIYEFDDSDYRPLFFITNDINYFTKPITDWRIPLSFDKEKNKMSTFFEGEHLPPQINYNFTSVEPNSVLLKVVKNPDPPLVLHKTFVTTPPWSLLYPLVILKEKIMLFRHGDYAYRYLIDRRLFLSAKRILELERWDKEIPILGTAENIGDLRQIFKEPKILKGDPKFWNLGAWHNVNSWEGILARYIKYFEDNINAVRNVDESVQWKTEQKFIINEYLLQHRVRLTNLISGLGKSEEKEAYLDKLTDSMFEYIFDKLNFSILDPSVFTYTPIDFQKDGTNPELYVERREYDFMKDQGVLLKFEDKELAPSVYQPEVNWARFEIPALAKKNIALTLIRNKERNIIRDAQFISLENIQSNEVPFINLKGLGWRNGLIWKINQWQPESLYFISFEYKSDTLFSLRLFERKREKEKKESVSLILENQLISKKWTRYQAVVRSSKYVDGAFLQLGGDRSVSPLPKIEFKNLSLLYLPNPRFFLKEESVGVQKEPHQIAFTKVNPTKYKITVKDANNPYFLILSQEFNSRWKLFLEDGETLGKTSISEKNHFPVNGYANAWYIVPSDVKNAKEYTVIAEMYTQQYFYFGLAISTMTLMGIMIFGIYKRYYEG